MERTGDELFPGPAFARDENGRRRVGDAIDHIEDLEHPRAPADDLETPARFSRVARGGLAELARASGLHHSRAQFIRIERFGDVVERTQFEGLDAGIDRTARRDHEHWDARIFGGDVFEDAHPIEAGHLEIGDDEIDVMLGERGDRLFTVAHPDYIEAIPAELRL